MTDRTLTAFVLAYMVDHPECGFDELMEELNDELLWELEALEADGEIDCVLSNAPAGAYVTYKLRKAS